MNIAPGLNGLLAQRQMASQSQAGELGQIQGLLGIQNAMFDQQLNPLKMEQLKVQLADAKRKSELVNGLLSGQGSGGSTPVQMGPNGTPIEGGISVPGQAPRASGLLGAVNDPQTVMALKLAGVGDFTEMYKFFNTPQKREGGSFYVNPITGAREFTPKVGEGMNFNDGAISPAPGYIDALGKIEGAKEGARAGLDIVKIPDGNGGEISLPRSIAVQLLTQNAPKQPQMQPQPAPAPSMAPTQFSPQGQQVNPNDPLLASGLNPQQVSSMRSMDAAGLPFSTTVPGLQPRVSQPAPASPAPASGPIPTSRIVGGFGQAPNPIDVKVDEKRALNAVEKAGDLPQAQLRIETQVGDIQRLTKLANEIMSNGALNRSVGFGTYFPSVRGGEAANVEALVSSLKAQVSGMKLQAMRDASKTGGAVGNVTEKEWPRLESMIIALDQEKMSGPKFREKLGELVLALRDAESNIKKAFTAEYGSVGGAAPAGNGWAVIK